MPFVFFDSETTGMPDWNAPSELPHQPHIVELAGIITTDDGEITDYFDEIIKPDGWIIPAETIAVHGISNEYALDIGIPEKDAVERFLEFVGDNTRVAHNTTFDNRIIRIATKRFFSEDVQEKWHKGKYICTLAMAKRALAGTGVSSELKSALKYLTGKEQSTSHRAMPDTLACKDLFFAINKGVAKAC